MTETGGLRLLVCAVVLAIATTGFALSRPSLAEAHYLPLGPTQARFLAQARAYCASHAQYLNSSDYFYVGQACAEVKGILCLRGAFGISWFAKRQLDPAAGLAGHPWNPEVELPHPGPYLDAAPVTNSLFIGPSIYHPPGSLYGYARFMGGLAFVRGSLHAKRAHTASCIATLYAPAPEWTRAYDDHYLQYLTGGIVMQRQGYATRTVRELFSVTRDRS
jgi:hypothetical protein